jgi:hypothetical protein
LPGERFYLPSGFQTKKEQNKKRFLYLVYGGDIKRVYLFKKDFLAKMDSFIGLDFLTFPLIGFTGNSSALVHEETSNEVFI